MRVDHRHTLALRAPARAPEPSYPAASAAATLVGLALGFTVGLFLLALLASSTRKVSA